MKGKWAAGISPRNFTWVIRDRFAVSERPGGFGASHRKVRREEELLWLSAQGFDRIISLLPGPSNLPAYDGARPRPTATTRSRRPAIGVRRCASATSTSTRRSAPGSKVLLHGDELGDRVMGVVAGYLSWSGRIAQGPASISAVEHLFERSMGPDGRALVADSERPGARHR